MMGARSLGSQLCWSHSEVAGSQGNGGRMGKGPGVGVAGRGGTPGLSAAALYQLEQKYVNILTSRTVI